MKRTRLAPQTIARTAVLQIIALLLVAGSASAEVRTWTAAAGGFKVDAEFVELVAGTSVRMKLGSGELRDVPLYKLSAADQQYVRQRTTPGAAPTSTAAAGANKDRLAKITREAGRCRKAEDALRLYKIFASAPDSTDADRAAAAEKIAELETPAAQNLFRVAGKWVTEEETVATRKKANELMKQGMEVLKLGQEDTFRKKFAEASALEPEEIRADYILAVMYSASNRNKNNTRAVQYYQTCLKRDPTNLGVLNNLALMFVRSGEYHSALQLWKQAMAISPEQRICHNIGKLVKLASNESIPVSKAIRDQLTELYISNTGEGKLKPTDPARGWLHLLTDDAGLDLELDASTSKTSVVPEPSDAGPVVGGGSGFFIDSKHIVTNAHVVEGGTSFEIQFGNRSKTETIQATVVATSKKPDLAILRCETTFSSPVTLDPTPCRRGTDIMVLGYPEMFELGASLKATRGVISGLPSAALDDLYLYDAVTNGGNSGGPVFDAKGNVIAVHCIGVNTASRYGGGIPADQLLTFLQKSLPTYRQREPATKTLEWTAVDEKVSPATVLIWVRKRNGAATSATMIAGTLEDKSCLGCKGLGLTKCLNGGCVNGVMSVRVGGGSVKARCPICKGSGTFPCLMCEGKGVDKEVSEASDAAAANATAVAAVNPKADPSSPGGGSASGPTATQNVTGDSIRPHTPLAASTADLIDKAVADRMIENPKTFESGGTPRRVMSRSNGILIALDVSSVTINNVVMACAVRPTFLTRSGREEGEWIGTPKKSTIHMETSDGNAIGVIYYAIDGNLLVGLQARTNNIRADHLFNNGFGHTAKFGFIPTGRNQRQLAGQSGGDYQDFVVGITGVLTQLRGVEVLGGFGIVTARTTQVSTTGVTITPPKVTATPPPTFTPPKAMASTTASSNKSIPDELRDKVPSALHPSEMHHRHVPLDGRLADNIKASIADNRTVETNSAIARSEDEIHREIPPSGGVLIGFDVSYGTIGSEPLIRAIRPYYLTPKGKIVGAVIGTAADAYVHIEAKPGYAISRFDCKNGLFIDSISVTFSKLTPTGFDLTDSYEGSRYGGGGGDFGPLAGGDGDLIIGIVGTTLRDRATNIGGVVVPAMSGQGQ